LPLSPEYKLKKGTDYEEERLWFTVEEAASSFAYCVTKCLNDLNCKAAEYVEYKRNTNIIDDGRLEPITVQELLGKSETKANLDRWG